jgi:hypothetical protein
VRLELLHICAGRLPFYFGSLLSAVADGIIVVIAFDRLRVLCSTRASRRQLAWALLLEIGNASLPATNW